MKKFLKYFKNPDEDKLNLPLIKREMEGPLHEFVIEVFKSLEAIPFIKFLDYTIEFDESKINFSKYITSRKKKKKNGEKFHYIKPDRAYELTMRFLITVKDERKVIKRNILLPKKDRYNYNMLKGKKYFLLYQLLDSSTYVVKNGITLKSLMPIVINYRDREVILEDIHGKEYPVITYFMKVFKRDISVFIFFFCKFGFKESLKYFNINQIVKLITAGSEDYEDEEHLYFKVNKHYSFKVIKSFFDKYEYVRAITGMLFECFASKTSPSVIESKSYWLERLGSLYTSTKHKKIDSGRSTMLLKEAA